MTPYLIVLSEGSKGKELPLAPQKKMILGRGREADFSIPEKKISRKHSAIQWNDETNEITLEDLQSLNGTYLNGKQIEDTIHLKNGDHIQVGSYIFELVLPAAKEESLD